MKVNFSDLVIINRALAHDAALKEKEKSFGFDSDGNIFSYYKRMPSIMSAKETAKDIEVSAGKMLTALPADESRKIRLSHSHKPFKERNISYIIDIVTKYSDFDELALYAPNLIKIIK